MINKYLGENKIFPRQSEPAQENTVQWYYIVPSVSLAVVLLVVVVLVVRKCIGSRNLRKVNTKFTASNTDPNSPEYIYRHVYQNHKNPIYLVPYSALPENFDFSRSDITVRGDYIILKDLHVLEQPVIRPPSTPTTPVSASFPQIHFEGYQRQPPYNPNVY